ncbi:tetratricopeptide repeat protein [Carnobacterium funditum]|uniref:tetratricopeptide repeat protein n=1 Tax=Carnobacterium funditum TaxID=2752 RepID=UPI00068D5F93|nr:tetratricopeptide repeat protein [Carnobacterium funditum]
MKEEWVKDMGEKIEFPNNYEAYINKGLKYVDLGDMKEAETCFEKAYAIKQEPKINALYATTLYQNGEYKKAKAITDEEIDYYNSEDNLTAFYVSILIKGHYFIQAEKIVKSKLAQNKKDASKWHSLSKSIEKEKEQVQLQNEKKYEAILKNVFSMGNQSFEIQARTIKEVNQLPLPLFIKAATTLLSNPFVNGIAKTTVLEYLIEQKVDNTFVLEWFGEQRVIKPVEILPVAKNKTVQEIEGILKETIENNDPVLFQVINQEANLHFMLLYPFIDEVIESPSQWVSLYLKRYDQVHEVSTKDSVSLESNTMNKWMHRLNDEIQKWI